MLDKTAKIIIAYVFGQVTQLIVHAISLNLWNSQQIPFCIAGGFVVFFALIAGVVIAKGNDEPKHEKKTYLDWAEIPEKSKAVINPFKPKEEASK